MAADREWFDWAGASQEDDDLYVMVNAYWNPLEFVVQEGRSSQWQQVVNTGLESPPTTSASLGGECGRPRCVVRVGPRSVVVPLRAVGHAIRPDQPFR
jgi:glycogen operon protein